MEAPAEQTAGRASVSFLEGFHRSPQQILEDDALLAARKAAKPPKHERGRDRRQRRQQREAQRNGKRF